RASDLKALAALGTPTGEDAPAGGRCHARAEAVRLGTLAAVGLVGTLHALLLVRPAAGALTGVAATWSLGVSFSLPARWHMAGRHEIWRPWWPPSRRSISHRLAASPRAGTTFASSRAGTASAAGNRDAFLLRAPRALTSSAQGSHEALGQVE